MSRPLVIWGAASHARVVAAAVIAAGTHEVVAFADDVTPRSPGGELDGRPILTSREELTRLRATGVEDLALGVGSTRGRRQLVEAARALGFRLATVVHPSAVVAHDAVIGDGTFLAAGAIVNAAAVVGESVIVNTSAIIEHETRVGAAAMVNARVLVCGRCAIGAEATIEVGTIVTSDRTIGERAIVGAASLVLDDVPADVVAFGMPAKIVRRVDE